MRAQARVELRRDINAMGKNISQIYILSPQKDRRKKKSQVNDTKSQTHESRRREEEMSGTVEISIVSASFPPHATFDSGVLYYPSSLNQLLSVFVSGLSISIRFYVTLCKG